jgi:hypothetical protein
VDDPDEGGLGESSGVFGTVVDVAGSAAAVATKEKESCSTVPNGTIGSKTRGSSWFASRTRSFFLFRCAFNLQLVEQ